MKNNNIFNSIKTKAPSTCQRVPLDGFLSSLKCEMSVTSLVMGVIIGEIWIRILDADFSYRPTKSISPVSISREHGPDLSVCLNGLSLCNAACLLGV